MHEPLANATALYLEGIRDGRVPESVEAYTGLRYTQHCTGVADGVEGFGEFFDLYRVADGMIVEHWSNSEPVPEGPQPNGGKF